MQTVDFLFSLHTTLLAGWRRPAAAVGLPGCWIVAAVLCSVSADALQAQTFLPRPISHYEQSSPASLSVGAAAASSPGAALGIEALGGTAGAALGYGMLFLIGNDGCGENLSCTLSRAASALLAGTFGAGGGAYAAGRLFDTRPSGWGAVAGAVVGTAAVLGLEHAIGESSWMNDGARVAIYSVTHGTIAALGSRVGAALR